MNPRFTPHTIRHREPSELTASPPAGQPGEGVTASSPVLGVVLDFASFLAGLGFLAAVWVVTS
jgi:hypothetical protein